MAGDGHAGTWVVVYVGVREGMRNVFVGGGVGGWEGGLLLSSRRRVPAPKRAGRIHRKTFNLFWDLGKSQNCLSSKKPWRIRLVLAQRIGQHCAVLNQSSSGWRINSSRKRAARNNIVCKTFAYGERFHML